MTRGVAATGDAHDRQLPRIHRQPASIDRGRFPGRARIGESVSLSVDGNAQDLRVSRVVHVPDGSLEGAAITLEVTGNIL
ncbi:hypothetical protein [Mesorhizobium sp. B2-4-11]|uniref:hypothetical protein n=1 Tax=Mesorhizobium sp. B2-4-11 TaxID=2589938 RepID=UPI001FF034D0|nr:hypothetical protein [Mesorhizobium sp. B2-4-11]